jgi:hypothetical protein
MKTKQWERQARIDGVVWDLELRGPWLDARRNGCQVKTVYRDGREELWASDPWPEEIVAAWQEMLDVMRREAVR